MDENRPGMFSKNIVCNITEPDLETYSIMLFGIRARELIRGTPLVVILPLEPKQEFARLIVDGAGDIGLAVPVGHLIDPLQEGVAAGHHLVLGKGVIRDVGVPARLLARADFEETNCLEHSGSFRRCINY